MEEYSGLSILEKIDNLIGRGRQTEALELIIQENQALMWEGKLVELKEKLSSFMRIRTDIDEGLYALLVGIIAYDNRFQAGVQDEEILDFFEKNVHGLSQSLLSVAVQFNYLGLLKRNIHQKENGKDTEKAEKYKDESMTMFKSVINGCNHALESGNTAMSSKDAMIWKGYALFNLARFKGDIEGVHSASKLRKSIVNQYQKDYIEGKEHLHAEYGYACATLCMMILDKIRMDSSKVSDESIDVPEISYQKILYNKKKAEAYHHLKIMANEHPLSEQYDLLKKKEKEILDSQT